MPLRNVWASPAARDATKEERAAHAQCTTREEAVRLLQVMARSWGVEPEAAAADEGLCAALCTVLKRLGRDVRTAYLLEANLDAWIKENEARTRNGARQDQRLLAASALYDVRVVVLSTASPEALAYDADPEKPTDEITLGQGRLVVREAGDGPRQRDAVLAAVADREARRAVERDGVAPLRWFVAALLVARVALFHAIHHLLEGLVLGVLAVARVRVRHGDLWCCWSCEAAPRARRAQI